MISEELKLRLKEAAGDGNYYTEEPMKRHTTFRIGGPAEVFLAPTSLKNLQKIFHLCREEKLPLYVIGNGSNLLVSDEGIRGVVLQIYKGLSDIRFEGNHVMVQAGALLTKVAAMAAERGLTGLEFASGIPGTVGGAIAMNAGAYGGEIKDVLVKVNALDRYGRWRIYDVDDMNMGYRTSLISDMGYIVMDAEFILEPGDPEEICAKMEELKALRIAKQPIELPSAGSTFKRPAGYFAGKLIEDAGLKGYHVGDAAVSSKHAGFVVNEGEASAAQVMELVEHVKKTVAEQSGVNLELEVKVLGEF